MGVVMTSVGEIERVGVWALRALGYEFGLADRTAKLLSLCEAVDGGVLRALRLEDAAIRHSTGNARPLRLERTEAGWLYDTDGRFLYETGAAAVDLASALAAAGEAGRVEVPASRGAKLAPGLIELAVRRGHAGFVVLRDGQGKMLRWLAGATDDGAPRFWSGTEETALVAIAGKVLALSGRAGVDAAQWLEMDCSKAREVPNGFAMVIAALALPKGSLSLGELPKGAAVLDIAGLMGQAQRAGLKVQQEDHANIYALERQTWAPTSEKSRLQAGF